MLAPLPRDRRVSEARTSSSSHVAASQLSKLGLLPWPTSAGGIHFWKRVPSCAGESPWSGEAPSPLPGGAPLRFAGRGPEAALGCGRRPERQAVRAAQGSTRVRSTERQALAPDRPTWGTAESGGTKEAHARPGSPAGAIVRLLLTTPRPPSAGMSAPPGPLSDPVPHPRMQPRSENPLLKTCVSRPWP